MRWEVEPGHRFEADRIVHVRVTHADEREVPEDDRSGHDPFVFGCNPGSESRNQVPAVERHAPERLGGGGPADRIERNIHSAPVRRRKYGSDEVFLSVVDDDVRTEVATHGQLLG